MDGSHEGGRDLEMGPISKRGKWNCLPRRREEVQIVPIEGIGCVRANGVEEISSREGEAPVNPLSNPQEGREGSFPSRVLRGGSFEPRNGLARPNQTE